MKLALLAPLLLASLSAPEFSSQTGPDPSSKPVVTEAHVEPGTSRAWALLITSVPFERDNFQHDTLAGCRVDPANIESLKKLLLVEAHAKRHVDLVKTLDDLNDNGHRVLLAQMVQKFRDTKLTEKDIAEFKDEKLRESTSKLLKLSRLLDKKRDGLLAWDYVHLVTYCRFGCAVGYLSEEEAWHRIEPVAKKLQKTFASWEELGEFYCAVLDTSDEPKHAEARAALKKLASDAESPWRKTPWDLKLGKPDKPETPPAKPASPPEKKDG